MAREIEDRFLVLNDTWRELSGEKIHIAQTYILSNKFVTARIRTQLNGPTIFCIKLAERDDGIPEYEWKLPTWMSKFCSRWHSRTIKKIRHILPWGELNIEVDEFFGDLSGLVIAEVELPQMEYEYIKPEWFGKNITKEIQYKNAVLVKKGLPN